MLSDGGKILFKQSNADVNCDRTDTNDAECSGHPNSAVIPENTRMLQGKRFGSNEEEISETEACFKAKDLSHTSHLCMGFDYTETKTDIWISFPSFIRSGFKLPQEKYSVLVILIAFGLELFERCLCFLLFQRLASIQFKNFQTIEKTSLIKKSFYVH